jgi:hypothetical protein
LVAGGLFTVEPVLPLLGTHDFSDGVLLSIVLVLQVVEFFLKELVSVFDGPHCHIVFLVTVLN